MPEYKKSIHKKILCLEYKTRLRPSYLLATISAISIYVILLYIDIYGISDKFAENFTLLQYLLLVPMLLSVFCNR